MGFGGGETEAPTNLAQVPEQTGLSEQVPAVQGGGEVDRLAVCVSGGGGKQVLKRVEKAPNCFLLSHGLGAPQVITMEVLRTDQVQWEVLFLT